MRLHRIPGKLFSQLRDLSESRRRQALIRGYDFGGCKRVYFHHIRKTGGTSLAQSFLGFSGRCGAELYHQLGRPSDRPLVVDGMVFVGWDRPLIESGQYAFAFSHYPQDELQLPPDTFRLTCFRDPIDRVISHYRMLLDLSRQSEPHPCLAVEGEWLGAGFGEFLNRIPPQHLLNQLFMFSTRFDVREAAERVGQLDHVLWLENYEQGLAELSHKIDIPLEPTRQRISQSEPPELSRDVLKRLRELLKPEYEFLQAAGLRWQENREPVAA